MIGTKQTANNGSRGVASTGRPKESKKKVTGVLKEASLIGGEQAGNQYGNDGLVIAGGIQNLRGADNSLHD